MAHSQRMQSFRAGKAQQQEREAAGHSWEAEREMEATVRLPFSLIFSQGL